MGSYSLDQLKEMKKSADALGDFEISNYFAAQIAMLSKQI